LGVDRSRNRGEREQEEQDQGGAHRGEHPPAPAQPADQPEPGGPVGRFRFALDRGGGPGLVWLRHQITGSNPATHPCSWATRPPHHPVTSSRPTVTSMAPPIRVMRTVWRRSALIAYSALR